MKSLFYNMKPLVSDTWNIIDNETRTQTLYTHRNSIRFRLDKKLLDEFTFFFSIKERLDTL